jgi:membrane fusion protein, multidrug efflux system
MGTSTEKNKKANIIMPIILGAVLLVGCVIGLVTFMHGYKITATDNAQIDADVTPLSARVGGVVNRIRFTDNQYVHVGDTLFLIDDNDYRIKFDQAENALEAAKLNVNISTVTALSYKANITTAQSNIAAAQARLWKATEDFERYTTLMQNQATTQERLDAAKAEKDAAEAQMATVKSQLNSAGNQATVADRQIDGAAITIRQKMTELDYARLQLSYATIISPVSGVVSRRSVQIGQLVQPGTFLCAIVHVDSMYVTANFKETQVRKLLTGQQVIIKVDAFSKNALQGILSSFSGATGAKFTLLPPDNATGNFVKVVQRIPVKIAITKFNGLEKIVRPGMSVTVQVLSD